MKKFVVLAGFVGSVFFQYSCEASPCVLMGALHASGEAKVDGRTIKLPAEISECKGVIEGDSVTVIFRDKKNEKQILTLDRGANLDSAVKDGASKPDGMLNRVVAILKGQNSTISGYSRFDDDEVSGLPIGRIMPTGMDLSFVSEKLGSKAETVHLLIRNVTSGKVILNKSYPAKSAAISRTILRAGIDYEWQLSDGIGGSWGGSFEVLPAGQVASINEKIIHAQKGLASKFAKDIAKSFIYDEFSLVYDEKQLLDSLVGGEK